MSEFRLSFPASVIAGKNRLAADDILLLRNYTFPYGLKTADDVLVLMALQKSCPQKCTEWDDFFIEAMTDFIVHYSYPQGSLDEINAAWLIRLISTDGMVNSALELQLVLHVIGTSANVPPALGAFALDQLRLAIEEGVGPYAAGRPIARAGITRHDLDYIDRVLPERRSNARMALSQQKVDILVRIDRATRSTDNHSGWRTLMDMVVLRDEERRSDSRWLRVADSMLAV
jgi:hypothetical protein